MGLINQYADVSERDSDVSDECISENEEDKNFIDDSTQIESGPSDITIV